MCITNILRKRQINCCSLSTRARNGKAEKYKYLLKSPRNDGASTPGKSTVISATWNSGIGSAWRRPQRLGSRKVCLPPVAVMRHALRQKTKFYHHNVAQHDGNGILYSRSKTGRAGPRLSERETDRTRLTEFNRDRRTAADEEWLGKTAWDKVYRGRDSQTQARASC